MREKGTEAPFSGKLTYNKVKGVYMCAGCGQELFDSETKYDSESGWPSFYKAIDESKVREEDDNGRVEVLCNRCGGHLGHVFADGPRPTGMRYCINSAALKFNEK